jgi:hypothetical protein
VVFVRVLLTWLSRVYVHLECLLVIWVAMLVVFWSNRSCFCFSGVGVVAYIELGAIVSVLVTTLASSYILGGVVGSLALWILCS